MLSIFKSWDLKPDALETVEYLRSKGYRLCIVSGPVDLYVGVVAEKLGITDYYANTELLFDVNGSLVDFNYYRDQAEKKLEHLTVFLKKSNLTKEECVIIGNGDSDVLLFRELDYGIAVDTDLHDKVRASARHIVKELADIRSYL